MSPLTQQRRLAKSGRGGDKRQLAVQPGVQPLNQARTRDQLWLDGGDIEFGLQERRGHNSVILSRLVHPCNVAS